MCANRCSRALLVVLLAAGTCGAAERARPQGSSGESQSLRLEETGGAVTRTPPETDWLDRLLKEELDYSEEQIEQFKTNVADLPPEGLKAIIRHLKERRADGERWRVNSLQAHRASQANQQRELARAYANPSRVSVYNRGSGYSPPQIRSYDRELGNFRGVVVWVRVP